MGGVSVDISTTGLDELITALHEAQGELRFELEDALGEQALAFNRDLKGSGPGGGATPFKTGRLLMSGNVVQDGLNLVFENDADYAEWAHHKGGDKGDYARQSAELFEERFGDELTERWEQITTEGLDR